MTIEGKAFPDSTNTRLGWQWEDTWTSYLEVTRSFYRDLVSVSKNPHTGQLSVDSRAVRIEALRGADDGKRLPLFAVESLHNACWVIIDADRRHVTVWFHPFVPFW